MPILSPSPGPTRENHAADLEATMNAALNVDSYGQVNSEGHQQASNAVNAPTAPTSQPTMARNGYQGQQQQQYVSDEGMFTHSPLSPYDINSLIGTSSGPNQAMMTGAMNPVLGSHTDAAPFGLANNNYQPGALVGTSTQFPQTPQWTQTVPTPSAHERFSGYASQLEGHFNQAIPSLQNSLLNSPAPDHVLSGEHTERLLHGPPLRLERVLYGEGSAPNFNSAQIGTPETLLMSGALGGENLSPPAHLQDPQGCSLENTAYTDRSGWWYNGHHDDWCRIPNEHRHDYDGGVHFNSYDSYSLNIYDEQNDHLAGFMLGLTQQLQEHEGEGEEGAPMCLHQSCQEAHRVAQELIDATQPEGHELRQAPLRQPHPVVIRLLQDLNDRLPEGCVYDPITQRVVQYDLPDFGDLEPHNEPIESIEEDPVLEIGGQETA